MDFETAFNNYYPLIRAARRVKDDYRFKICSESVGELITELNKADMEYKVVLDGNN